MTRKAIVFLLDLAESVEEHNRKARRWVKLEAAKAWLKERGGANPRVLERFANRKGPMA